MMIMHRRRFLSLLAAVPTLGIAGTKAASAYDGYGPPVGHLWRVREFDADGSVWEGTWTRRGNSSVFDAQWRNNVTGGIAQDVIELRRFDGESVELYRYRHTGYYYGRLSRDGMRIRRGTASWYQPGSFWEAEIFG